MSSGADIDGQYRYLLWREWKKGFFGGDGGSVLFIMLNPSTADANVDDPTIRRCISFTRAWGFNRFEVVNLFAYRATDPRELLKVADPVGPLNDDYIQRASDRADLIVCAWGAMGFVGDRAKCVQLMLTKCKLHALSLTRHGQPGHPLYTPKTTKLEVFR